MTIDFDGWTTYCTYEYIYSHDNNRFIKNCMYDRYTANRGNTVRYCLSVNDNNSRNILNTPLIATENILGMGLVMEDFTFCNNTIVNASPIQFDMLRNAIIMNNLVVGQSSKTWQTFFTGITAFTVTGEFENNCFFNYVNPATAKRSIKSDPELNEKYIPQGLPRDIGALDGSNYVGCRLPKELK